jgi:hypothetical protein
MRPVFAALTVLFGIICSQPAIAKPSFAKFDTQPANGGVLFLAPILPQPYVVWISQLNPDGKPGKTERLTISDRKTVKDPANGLGVTLVSLPAGPHAIRLILLQDHWGACLAQNTVSFTVQPGKIVYLGNFQPIGPLESLEAEVLRTGKTSAIRTQLRMFRDNLTAPSFSLEGAPKAEEILAVIRASGFTASFPLVQAHAMPATFPSPPGSDMIGYCD